MLDVPDSGVHQRLSESVLLDCDATPDRPDHSPDSDLPSVQTMITYITFWLVIAGILALISGITILILKMEKIDIILAVASGLVVGFIGGFVYYMRHPL